MSENFANDYADTLAVDISTLTRPVTFTVTGGAPAGLTVPFRVRIDNELLLVTAVSGTSFTGTNVEGTAAAYHFAATAVLQVVTAGGLKAAIDESLVYIFF